MSHWKAWAAAWRWRLWSSLGPPATALVSLEKWLACHSPELGPSCPLRCSALATQAHLLAGAGQWCRAASVLTDLQAQQPDVAAHSFNLGYVFERMEQPLQAQAAFERALVLNPRMDLAWYGLGEVLFRQGLLGQAVKAWEQQVSLQPFCPHGLERLVVAHAAQAQWTQARQRLDQLRCFEPRRAMALEPVVQSSAIAAGARLNPVSP